MKNMTSTIAATSLPPGAGSLASWMDSSIMTRVVLEDSHRACKKCALNANYGSDSVLSLGLLVPAR